MGPRQREGDHPRRRSAQYAAGLRRLGRFAGHYLTALDQARTAAPRIYGVDADYTRTERTGDLADWHLLLLERLEGTDTDHLLDRLVTHPQLTGPELTYLQAHRAIQTGAPDKARALMRDCLKTLPGHEGLPRVREKDQHPVKPTHVAGAQLSGRPPQMQLNQWQM
jgi:hypothetical protein